MEQRADKNILIVDDEMEVCVLLQNFLSRQNKKVGYSTTLKDALDKCDKLRPTFLILDHNMPDGFGIEYIPLFRKLNNSLQIIIISAMSNLREEALKNGADYFLEKPISFNELRSIIS
jgi:two-component system response regulator CitB